MKSVLIVSIAFPPKFDSEGLQVAKYFKYFKEEARNSFEIDVVTSTIPTLFMPVDNSLKSIDNGYRQKIEIRLFENKYVNFLLRKVNPYLIQRPDSKHYFFRQWKKLVRQLKHKPSIIYSRSYPISSAIMALKLKEYYKVPWIMHVSDPWADDPVANFTGKVKDLNQALERECFTKADKVCLTSHQTIAYFKNKYPEHSHKLEYFPNVYDSADIMEVQKELPNKKLKIVHTGGLAGIRSPETFLKAVSLLPQVYKDQMEVIFSGIVDRKNRALFEVYKDSCIQYLGASSYKGSIKLQQSADVLLLIDFPIKEPKLRMHFLSKLLDYMVARKYILGITGIRSTCREFINDGRGHCFEESDPKRLSKHLEYLVEKFNSEKEYFQINKIDSQYEAKYNAKRLLHLINSVLRDKGIDSSLVAQKITGT